MTISIPQSTSRIAKNNLQKSINNFVDRQLSKATDAPPAYSDQLALTTKCASANANYQYSSVTHSKNSEVKQIIVSRAKKELLQLANQSSLIAEFGHVSTTDMAHSIIDLHATGQLDVSKSKNLQAFILMHQNLFESHKDIYSGLNKEAIVCALSSASNTIVKQGNGERNHPAYISVVTGLWCLSGVGILAAIPICNGHRSNRTQDRENLTKSFEVDLSSIKRSSYWS